MDVLQHAHVQRWVSHESTGSMLKADNTTGYFGVHHHPAPPSQQKRKPYHDGRYRIISYLSRYDLVQFALQNTQRR